MSKKHLIAELVALRRAIEQEVACPLPSREQIAAWERQYAKKAQELAAWEVRAYRKKHRI